MKKKFLAAMAAVTLLAMGSAMASAETVSLAYSDGSLNLRKGPGTQYKSMGIVRDGDTIDVLNKGDIWSQVKTKSGTIGYIKNLYIEGNGSVYASGTTYNSNRFTVYTTAKVNFRAGASTDTAVMGTFAKGAKLKVLGENGNFYLVEDSEEHQGFVSKNYVSRSSVSSSESATANPTKTVSVKSVNMRKGGGTSYEVMKVLTKGTEVEVLKVGNFWTQVKYQGETGWIKSVYLK